MTNASVKNTLFALLGIVLFASFSVVAFATTVHAQDDGSTYADSGSDGSDTSGYTYADTGYSPTDTSGYTYADTGYTPTDTSGYTYADTGYSPTDTSGYTYADTGYNGGCDSTCDQGYTYADTGYTSTDCGCTEQNGVGYTDQSYSNSTPSYSTPSYSTPLSFSAPSSYYQTPIPAPIIQTPPVVYQQQQQQQQQQIAQPNVTTNNTCTNYSCNSTYTDNSINNSGNTTTSYAPVTPVNQTPVTYPVQYVFPQNVSCSISASPNSVQNGQYSYLSWQSYGASYATLTNYGNVGPNGSLSVRPNGSTSYVLTVYGTNGQTATCNTYVTVQNIAPYVTLSQIPYTGFDFGTMGDAMYWAALAMFALAAGYLLVYYKGGMAMFAGSMIPMRRTTQTSRNTVASAPVRTETKVTPTVVATPAPIVRETAPARTATLASLPVAENARPTIDSMSIAKHDGAPRIVISRG